MGCGGAYFLSLNEVEEKCVGFWPRDISCVVVICYSVFFPEEQGNFDDEASDPL
jgi:hypothetical protein